MIGHPFQMWGFDPPLLPCWGYKLEDMSRRCESRHHPLVDRPNHRRQGDQLLNREVGGGGFGDHLAGLCLHTIAGKLKHLVEVETHSRTAVKVSEKSEKTAKNRPQMEQSPPLNSAKKSSKYATASWKC